MKHTPLTIPSIDADPRVQRAHAKHAQLLQRVADAEVAHQRSVDRVVEAQHAHREAAVAAALSDEVVELPTDASVTAAKDAVEKAAANVSVLKVAVEQQAAHLRAVRKEVGAEIAERVIAHVRVCVRRQSVLLDEIELLQRDVQLASQAGVIPNGGPLLQICSLLPVWKKAAERFCGPEPISTGGKVMRALVEAVSTR